MSKLTIFTMIYNDYYMLRQFIESIFNNVDKSTYDSILIFDDYSDPHGKLREYENWLEKTYSFIKIIKFDSYRRIQYYQDKLWKEKIKTKLFDWESITQEENLGVGRSFDLAMKSVDTEYVFYSDADAIFLKKSKLLLNELSVLLDSDNDVQIVGQARGAEGSEIQKYYKWFNYFDKRTNKEEPNGGDIGPVVAAIRVSVFKELGFKIDSGGRLGATFGYFTKKLLESGKYATMSYPIFTDLYMVHLGGGIIRRHSHEKELGFIFLKDVLPARGSMIGPRGADNTLNNRFYGRPFINMMNMEYINYITQLYSKPFSEIQHSIDENLIYVVD